MITEGKFGAREAGTLVITTIGVKVLLTGPRTVEEAVGSPGYIMTIISALTALLGFYFIYKLVKRFKGKDLNDIFIEVYGKYLGRAFALIIVLWLLYAGAALIREFIEILKSYSFIMSPPSYLTAIFLFAVVSLSYLGLEAMTRVNYLFSYVIWGALGLLFVLSIKYFRLYNLAPLWGQGADKVVYYGFQRCSTYGEVIILAIIASSINGRKEFKKAGLLALSASAWIASTSYLTFTLSFPYFVSREFTSPLFQLARILEYGFFFQRFESIFLLVWTMASVLTVSIYFYMALSLICKTLEIENHRPLILPLLYIFYSLSLYPESMLELLQIYMQLMRENAWLITFTIPLLTLVVAVIRRKGGKHNDKSDSAVHG